MKLIFNKQTSGEVSVQMQDGTIVTNFDYVSMVKQLICHNEVELEFHELDSHEQTKIEEMFINIKKAVDEGAEASIDN